MTNANDSVYPEIFTDIKEESGTYYTYSAGGLTKREHFAAMAMQGLLSRNASGSTTDFVEIAVNAANALIAELNK